MAVKKTVKRTVTTKTGPKTAKAAGSKPKARQKTSSEPAQALIALLDELAPDDISWLITQARALIYNHKVDEVNQAARELADAKNHSTGIENASSANKRTKTGPENIDIEQTGNGKSFNIILGNTRLFLNLNELKTLVKMSQLTDDRANASARIYRWMDKERRDMINDAGFAGPSDPRLGVIFGILREKFSVG